MNEPYLIIYDAQFTQQVQRLSTAYENDPDGPEVNLLIATLDAIDIVKRGEEAEHGGERLGYSDRHYDLRDCAEIKIDLLDERRPDGRSRGPSHRMIYREFAPSGNDPRPIRQIIAFEHRKDGRPFEVAAERLGRQRGAAIPGLDVIPNTVPATGRKKNPHRQIRPYRLPLPADLAAALSTAQRALPGRERSRSPNRWIRTADPPTRHQARDR